MSSTSKNSLTPLPQKWKKAEFNTCRIGLNCSEISSLTIKNIPTKEKLSIKITQSESLFTIHASNSSSTFELTTKSPYFVDPQYI
ncbi:Imm50 family immunity protein [Pseudomonas sp. F-14 TE3623]